MPEIDKHRRFELLQAERHQEQAHYWTRFTGFSTLHGGMFVVVTAANLEHRPVARIGIALAGVILSAVWAEVQRLSLKYVDRWKPLYHRERKSLGLVYQDGLDPRLSSTDLANAVPWIVLFIWAILFVFSGVDLMTRPDRPT